MGIIQAPSKADNCNPSDHYEIPAQSIYKFDDILTSTILGNPNCRVYLYGLNNSGDLVKLGSYGLVGDRIHIYSAVWGYSDEMYGQVYFPDTDFWAWLPFENVWEESDI